MITLPALREYQLQEVELAADTVARLTAAAAGKVTFSATATSGTWTMAATSYVGSIVIPEAQLLVRPKIGIENLLMLLDAGMPEEGWRPEVFGYGSHSELLPVFAAFFARTVDQLTSRGLFRSYRPESDRLPALRGRIDFAEQLRVPALPSPIACRFDEFTADVVENRYLLGAIDRLLRTVGIDPRTRSVLQHARGRFEAVASVLPTVHQLDGITFTRLTEHYRPALRLTRFVVENLSLADQIGAADASSFLLDMNRVFEDFVTRRLRSALAGRLVVLDQASIRLDERGKVPIRPDLLFKRRDEAVYVGDVKYKLTPSGIGRSSDYYQLLAYCTALDLDEGVLIYAQTDGALPEYEIIVRHARTRLITYRLDLSGGPADIESSVSALAEWLVERSSSGIAVLAGSTS